ncbi:DUF6314 family protein [Sinomonas halotolerans]|uniref:DUF6314 family protein n=1 Tax=Sinomonas halotolerans TaxID=1644133 RepID=A0ABU9WVV7_9MICC
MPDLRTYLRGTWALQRRLTDRASGTVGTFTGTVAFTDTPDGGLLQRESGTMRWGSHEGPAAREYVWSQTDEPSAMEVSFPDGRPFHRADLGTGSAGAAHWCSPDDYRVTYEALGPDSLRWVWDVHGPAKDLLLESELHRR